ncbi:MAG: hypothetical protein H6736_17140 [Alphaproteobacteria bacterium]|nr:hypothetical protein [Alphaproteobacteria bacterium]
MSDYQETSERYAEYAKSHRDDAKRCRASARKENAWAREAEARASEWERLSAVYQALAIHAATAADTTLPPSRRHRARLVVEGLRAALIDDDTRAMDTLLEAHRGT